MNMKTIIFCTIFLNMSYSAHASSWKKLKGPAFGIMAAAVNVGIAYQGIKIGKGELRSNATTLANLVGAFWALSSAGAVAVQCGGIGSESGYFAYKCSASANFIAMLTGFGLFMKFNPRIPITDAFKK